MKKKTILTISTILFVSIITVLLCVVFWPKTTQFTKGVWWWNDNLDSETYLSFAQQNGISEVYFCNSDFDEKTANFIKQAKEKNIKVFWLAGEYQWLENPTNLYAQLEKYSQFQQENQHKFSGVHLDIEPHQHPDFDAQRQTLIIKLVQLAQEVKTKYPNITFDFDIPFWLDDEITVNGVQKPAFQFMIDFANRVFIMSYRDTAEKIYSVSEDEIEYAKLTNKTLVLGVETKTNEYDYVTFFEEGKVAMQQELEKLSQTLPQNFGFCIHHIQSWYNLKD